MVIGKLVDAAKWGVKHAPQLCAEFECLVHFVRRVHELSKKHEVDADAILTEADRALTKASKVKND